MIKNKIITIIALLGLTGSLLAGCSPSPTTKIVEKAVTIDYNASPEQIATAYTEEGLRKAGSFFADKTSMDYALKIIGKQAPDFEAKNLNGDTVKLSDFKGKKVVIEILKSNCPICKQTAPILSKSLKDNQDVVYLPVFPLDDKTAIEAFYKEIGMEVDTKALIGKDNPKVLEYAKTQLSLTKVPALFFIDESGKFSFAHIGTFDEVKLKEYYEVAFGSKKLYNYVKTEKVEVDKDGKVIKVLEATPNTETSKEKGTDTDKAPTAPAQNTETEKK